MVTLPQYALLLKAKANPNLCTNKAERWLHTSLLASQEGHTDTVALLLKANANPNLQKDTGCNTSLHC